MTKWYSKQDEGFAESRVRGERILAPVQQVINAEYGFLTLDEVASFIWDHIGVKTSRDELKTRLLETYDAPENQIEQDLDEFLKELAEAGAIRECTGDAA